MPSEFLSTYAIPTAPFEPAKRTAGDVKLAGPSATVHAYKPAAHAYKQAPVQPFLFGGDRHYETHTH